MPFNGLNADEPTGCTRDRLVEAKVVLGDLGPTPVNTRLHEAPDSRKRTPGDPKRIGKYKILRRLGEGGMGVVYLAIGAKGANVALKVIRQELAADSDFRMRFAREVAAASKVSGTCTARVLDADPYAERPYLVTEYCDGLTLDSYVEQHGPLQGDALAAFAVGLAEALVAIHGAGLIHRDLKPSSILLSSDGKDH